MLKDMSIRPFPGDQTAFAWKIGTTCLAGLSRGDGGSITYLPSPPPRGERIFTYLPPLRGHTSFAEIYLLTPPTCCSTSLGKLKKNGTQARRRAFGEEELSATKSFRRRTRVGPSGSFVTTVTGGPSRCGPLVLFSCGGGPGPLRLRARAHRPRDQ